jgi:hypothetical protein
MKRSVIGIILLGLVVPSTIAFAATQRNSSLEGVATSVACAPANALPDDPETKPIAMACERYGVKTCPDDGTTFEFSFGCPTCAEFSTCTAAGSACDTYCSAACTGSCTLIFDCPSE